MPDTNEIFAGHRKNAKGHYVPENLIGPVDLLTDDMVNEIARQWKQHNQDLTDFKEKTFNDIHAMIATINEEYGVRKGGEKGNVQFFSFDGRYKLQVAVGELIKAGPELQAAREKVKECLANWSENSSPEVRAILEEFCATDAQGGIPVSRIMIIRRLRIQSEEWQLAMKAFDDALRIVGSKQYMRLYERDEAGGYKPIPLDIAAL